MVSVWLMLIIIICNYTQNTFLYSSLFSLMPLLHPPQHYGYLCLKYLPMRLTHLWRLGPQFVVLCLKDLGGLRGWGLMGRYESLMQAFEGSTAVAWILCLSVSYDVNKQMHFTPPWPHTSWHGGLNLSLKPWSKMTHPHKVSITVTHSHQCKAKGTSLL